MIVSKPQFIHYYDLIGINENYSRLQVNKCFKSVVFKIISYSFGTIS